MVPNIALIFIAIAAIIVVSFWVIVFIIFYHLVRFGVGTQPKFLSAVFILGSGALFILSVYFFVNVDWSHILAQLIQAIRSAHFFSTDFLPS